jgi:3' exoribonuclease, RNase T-like
VKYWIDTEFIAAPYTIDLISIGVVAEDGREFYAESSEVDWSKASAWTLANVRPQLDGKGMPREDIGYAVRQFTDGDEHPVFWGYFPAYDWVVLAGCSATSMKCRFTNRSFASTSNNGRSSSAIRNCRIRSARGITRCTTPAGPKRPGHFWRGLIPQPASGAPPAARNRSNEALSARRAPGEVPPFPDWLIGS